MNKRLIWIIELFIWLFILIGISVASVYIKSVHDMEKNSYYLFFNNVDGLVKGSQVRIMGLDVGYVQDIKIFDNKVFVAFLITNKDVPVPKHAIATIEFYGLGGSISLELTPVDIAQTGDDWAVPKEPYRIQNYYDTSKNIANMLIDIYGGLGKQIDDSKILQRKSIIKPCALTEKALSTMDKIDDSMIKTIYNYYEIKSRSVEPIEIIDPEFVIIDKETNENESIRF